MAHAGCVVVTMTAGNYSALCSLLCLARLPIRVKALLHTLQMNSFSPVCTVMWFCSVPCWLKARSHSVHLCGFSPVWIRLCAARLLDVENLQRQQTLRYYHLTKISTRLHIMFNDNLILHCLFSRSTDGECQLDQQTLRYYYLTKISNTYPNFVI